MVLSAAVRWNKRPPHTFKRNYGLMKYEFTLIFPNVSYAHSGLRVKYSQYKLWKRADIMCTLCLVLLWLWFYPLQMDRNIIACNSGPQLHEFVPNRTTITAERETEGRNPAGEYWLTFFRPLTNESHQACATAFITARPHLESPGNNRLVLIKASCVPKCIMSAAQSPDIRLLWSGTENQKSLSEPGCEKDTNASITPAIII